MFGDILVDKKDILTREELLLKYNSLQLVELYKINFENNTDYVITSFDFIYQKYLDYFNGSDTYYRRVLPVKLYRKNIQYGYYICAFFDTKGYKVSRGYNFNDINENYNGYNDSRGYILKSSSLINKINTVYLEERDEYLAKKEASRVDQILQDFSENLKLKIKSEPKIQYSSIYKNYTETNTYNVSLSLEDSVEMSFKFYYSDTTKCVKYKGLKFGNSFNTDCADMLKVLEKGTNVINLIMINQ